MIFYTVDLDENNNKIKGTARLLGKTNDEGSFYPDGCFIETLLRVSDIKQEELTSREIFQSFNPPLTKEEILYIHTARPQTYNLLHEKLFKLYKLDGLGDMYEEDEND